MLGDDRGDDETQKIERSDLIDCLQNLSGCWQSTISSPARDSELLPDLLRNSKFSNPLYIRFIAHMGLIRPFGSHTTQHVNYQYRELENALMLSCHIGYVFLIVLKVYLRRDIVIRQLLDV